MKKRRVRVPKAPDLIIEDFDDLPAAEDRYIEAARKRGYIQTEDTDDSKEE